MFFHYHEDEVNSKDNLNKTISYVLNATHVISIEEAGRIFTEKAHRDRNTDVFNFYVAARSPPIIIQMQVDDNKNANIARVFGQAFRDTSQRYFSEDYVTVNRNYIAHLLFDTHNVEQVIRIYFRNETNFSTGHTHIRLFRFIYGISTMSFLGWQN
jgi:hypothetical protein